MKKVLVVIVVILIVIIGAVYYFIPPQLHVSNAITINAAKNGVERVLREPTTWQKMFSANNASANFFIFDKDTISIKKYVYNGIQLTIDSQETLLHFIPIKTDSVFFVWETNLGTSTNPINKITTYNKAVQLKKKMAAILKQMKVFLDVTENIYGININRVSTTDTLLVATKKAFTYFPKTAEVYSLIGSLQKFIALEKATVKGNPIYHVNTIGKDNYELMVAIPVDRPFINKDNFTFKRMIPGSFMMCEVKGGDFSIEAARQKAFQFFTDYGFTAMAIDFNMAVTDRAKETDTAKWVTRIYLPVL